MPNLMHERQGQYAFLFQRQNKPSFFIDWILLYCPEMRLKRELATIKDCWRNTPFFIMFDELLTVLVLLKTAIKDCPLVKRKM